MTTLKWFLLAVFAVSAYWLWPIYVIVAIVAVSSLGAISSTRGHTRTYRSTRRPFRFKRPKRTRYPTPRTRRAKPALKGRLLKSGIRQHYRNGRWTPKAIKQDLPD